MEVIDSIDHQIHGKAADIIIDPDRGKIVALLIKRTGISQYHGLMVEDIESWGNRIHIRNSDVVGEISDFLRLKPYLEDSRTFVAQPIRTQGGRTIGRCNDVQFRTDTFDLEWIFPRRFFRNGLPLPVSEILKVTPEAIIIKDQGPKKEEVPAEEPVTNPVEPLPTPAAGLRAGFDRQAGRSTNRYTLRE